ncbi:uncharacterized protein B0H18DRAFT_1116915 [Fomitopsis serialis]|uniref:uncharacterized protein n=1 Tax=Fomitopsis serialis TaxID=139415 RepID=UPI0020076291|nr:uncharacterized protein B0H18DRAFT_1116915 [Neoantrodia serialis]KAH9930217.1 hypothetical protein B0H18DRAFT_1116915 [Neoantrodia serialis]
MSGSQSERKKIIIRKEPELQLVQEDPKSAAEEQMPGPTNRNPDSAATVQTDDLRPDGPPVPQLSQELRDIIIDSIPDRQDLLACCLASWAFLHRCRMHLYRRLRLKPLTNLDSFKKAYTPGCLLPYVREVEILGCLTPDAYPGDDANSGLNDEGEPDHRWMDAIVPFLTTVDPALIEWLDLRDLSWGDIAPATRVFLLTHFMGARRLTLSAIDFWNSNQMFRTLNAFPNIDGLSMETLSWHRANHARKQLECTANLHLRYLHIGQTEFARYGPFVQWLFGRRDVVTVDKAFIVWEDTEITSLITLLRRLAPSLKSLIYQQCMVMPGSEVVQARLEAAAAAAAAQAPAPAAQAQVQVQPAAPVPAVNVQATPPQDAQAPQPMEVENEPQQAPVDNDDDAAEAGDPMDVDAGDDEGDDDENDDDDDAEEGGHTTGPPIELVDDEREEEAVIEEFITENLRFPRERDALQYGMDLLRALPIEGSSVERLNARIAWSSLAVFGIMLVSQMFTVDTRSFSLLLVLPPMTQWERIDWISIDSLLDDVAQRAAKDAVLELSFLGAFTRREEDLPRIRAILTVKLPLLLARKRWTPRYDRSSL